MDWSPQSEKAQWFQYEFKSSVCQMKDLFSPEIVTQLFNQKYIIIKATYRPSLYTRILHRRLKRRETQIKGSKISNSLVWQNTVNQSEKEQHCNTTVPQKNPRDGEEQWAEI